MFDFLKKNKKSKSESLWAIDVEVENTTTEVAEKSTSITTFVGSEKCDILYYLVKLGLLAGKRILVIDNSFEKAFFKLCDDVSGDSIRSRGTQLMVCEGYKISREHMGMFDYAYVWLGHNADGICDFDSDYILYVTTQEMTDIEVAKRAYELYPERDAVKSTYILRDTCTNKITSQTAKSMCGMTTDNVHSISFDTMDYATYVGLTHNKSANYKQLSNDMYFTIIELAEEIYDLKEKQSKKLMKG